MKGHFTLNPSSISGASRRRTRALLPLFALLLPACTPVPAPAQNGPATWAFSYPTQGKQGNPLLDLRSLNEKTAGESGFVQRTPDGNGFALGNGKPVRFWAVGSDVYRSSPEEMARHARFLAKMGVNMVRLHTQIAPESGPITGVNEKEIDGIWRMVAAMKKEGIYVTISPYWASTKDASQWGIAGYEAKTDLWGLLFFDETLQKGYKTWVKALYTRPNPYTGTPLARDPAVAIIQVQNEDSLLFWTLQALKPEQKERLGLKFGQWLVKKYGSLDKAKQAWEGTGNEGDNFTKGVVGISPTWMFTQEQIGGQAKRLHDELNFYSDLQRGFYADIADYYHKALGCKQLINASNWYTADPIKLNDVERYTYTSTDVLAVNRYYDGGVHTGPNSGWRIDPGDHFTQTSALLDPRALPTNLKQVVGYPMMITESTWGNPNVYQSEGPFLIAAYESLTGVDTFYWFSAGAPEYQDNPYFPYATLAGNQHPYLIWVASSPQIIGNFPAAALLFRNGYVKQGEPVVHEERTLEDLWNRRYPLIAEDKSFDPNHSGGQARVDGKANVVGGADPLAFLVGPVEVKYGGDPAKSTVVDLKKYIDHENETITSVTGELKWDYNIGLCTLNAPKAQGATGFLSKADSIKLGDITIRSGNDYATVIAVSMDGLPLKESKKILVQVGTKVRPTGWQTKATEFKSDDGKQTYQGYEVVNTGRMPYQITATDMTLSVANPNLTKAIALDSAGYTAKEAAGPSASVGGKFTFKLPPDAMYVILE